MIYENTISENSNFDEETNKVLSYAQRSQIYAMTAITALNSGDSEKAVWNAVRAQKYVSQIQEIIQISSPGKSARRHNQESNQIQSFGKDDVESNNLLDEFEKLIIMHDSYGAFRRLAAKKLGVPAIKVTIKKLTRLRNKCIELMNLTPIGDEEVKFMVS